MWEPFWDLINCDSQTFLSGENFLRPFAFIFIVFRDMLACPERPAEHPFAHAWQVGPQPWCVLSPPLSMGKVPPTATGLLRHKIRHILRDYISWRNTWRFIAGSFVSVTSPGKSFAVKLFSSCYNTNIIWLINAVSSLHFFHRVALIFVCEWQLVYFSKCLQVSWVS